MSTHEQTEDSAGTLRKVATGLYRFSTSGVYFANVRIRGKLFRQGLETSDRATGSLATIRASISNTRSGKKRFVSRRAASWITSAIGGSGDTAEPSADFVEFNGRAGLGQAEASSLSWADVGFERGATTTFRHKTRQDFTIPIYPQLRPLLERLRGETPRPPDEGVFRDQRLQEGDCRGMHAPGIARLHAPLVPPVVHHEGNREGDRREGDCRMAGTPRRREVDSRHLLACEPRSFSTHG
jgi:integrase